MEAEQVENGTNGTNGNGASLEVEPELPELEVKEDPLLYTADRLELSIRLQNLLSKSDIRYVGELVQKTESEMLKTKYFGPEVVREIKEALFKLGLGFGMKLDNWPPKKDLLPTIVSGPIITDDAVPAEDERRTRERDIYERLVQAKRMVDKLGLPDTAVTVSDLLEISSVLMGDSSVGRKEPGEKRPKKASASKKAGTVSPEALLREIKKAPDSRVVDLAEAMGTDTHAIKPVMAQLVEEKLVRKRGRTRGARYKAV